MRRQASGSIGHAVPGRPAMRVGVECRLEVGAGRGSDDPRGRGNSAGEGARGQGRGRQQDNHRGLHGSLLWRVETRARLCARAAPLSTR
ncbi:hypothetical protein RZS08_02490, partial [Arthrospira platensis SPKY1]|nr:hypothetical protein [Arthrospira platensis SPKY1]